MTDSGQHGPESRSRTGEDGYLTLGQGGPKLGEMGRRKERIRKGELVEKKKKLTRWVEGPPRHDFLPTLYGWLQSFPVIPFEL